MTLVDHRRRAFAWVQRLEAGASPGEPLDKEQLERTRQEVIRAVADTIATAVLIALGTLILYVVGMFAVYWNI